MKIFAFCIVLLLAVTASAQDNKSIVAHANGDGTLKIGEEKFKVSTVVIKLFEDGKAEINLVSEITVFVSGSRSDASRFHVARETTTLPMRTRGR